MAGKKAAPAAAFTGVAPNVGDDAPLPKLRDIAEMELKLQTLLEAAEGEVTPEIEQIMAELEQDRPGFFERWGLHLLNDEAKLAYLKGAVVPFETEVARIKDRIKSVEHDLKRSRDRLYFELKKRDIDTIGGKDATVSIVKNPPKVVGAETVPVEVLEHLFDNAETRHLISYTPAVLALDKAAVKKEVETGALPEELVDAGVGLEQGERVVVR